MKIAKRLGFVVVALSVAGCGSTAKTVNQEPRQTPLKLSSASPVLTQTCSSYGCDGRLRRRCNGGDFRILAQDTKNKYTSKKNQTTGTWNNSRKETVEIAFKCKPASEADPVQ